MFCSVCIWRLFSAIRKMYACIFFSHLPCDISVGLCFPFSVIANILNLFIFSLLSTQVSMQAHRTSYHTYIRIQVGISCARSPAPTYYYFLFCFFFRTTIAQSMVIENYYACSSNPDTVRTVRQAGDQQTEFSAQANSLVLIIFVLLSALLPLVVLHGK